MEKKLFHFAYVSIGLIVLFLILAVVKGELDLNKEAEILLDRKFFAESIYEWQEYKNEELGFSLTVPSDAKIATYEGSTISVTFSNVFFNVTVGDNPTGLSPEARFKENSTKESYSFIETNIIRSESTVLNGYPAFKVEMEGLDNREQQIYIAKDDLIYGLHYPISSLSVLEKDFGEIRTKLEKILESFKFLPDYAGWTTYSDGKYKFSISLPPRWREFKASEVESGNGLYSIDFSLPLKPEYSGYWGDHASAFVITVYTKSEWENFFKSDAPPRPSLITEKEGLVFTYWQTQDDTGFKNFPEYEEGVPYEGLHSDLKNLIIPSFRFNE